MRMFLDISVIFLFIIKVVIMYWFLALHCIGLYKCNGVAFLYYIVQLLPIPCLSHLVLFLPSIDFTTMPASTFWIVQFCGLCIMVRHLLMVVFITMLILVLSC